MNLTVVGGYYDECCAEPYWYERWGSGGRAAAALSGRKAAIEFMTYCPSSWISSLEHLSSSFKFTSKPIISPCGVTFRYLHWLRSSGVYPQKSIFKELPAIKINDSEKALCFGLYEAGINIKAKRAVYDPQNENSPKLLNENDSTVEEFALVCNLKEGSILTGEKEPQKIVSSLLNRASVVVLKCAWSGAIAATKRSQEKIPPIPTRRVHKIGSGDIFSAEFAYNWMILNLDPVESARNASQRVAYYCENGGVLPLPNDLAIEPLGLPTFPVEEKKYDVYLAGPFFSANELALVEEINGLLFQAGARVFSPYHDVGLGEMQDVAQKDLGGLRAARFVFACLDNFDPGTVFEVGYARALGIPVIVYSPNLMKPHSAMFVGSGCEIVTDLTTAIYRAAWWLMNK